MGGVLAGYAVIAVVIGVGYLIARLRLLGPGAELVLGRLSFFVLLPMLLFAMFAKSDTQSFFSPLLPIAAISAFGMIAVYALVAGLMWRRPVGATTIGALAAGYQNAGNIGIPLSIYVLGDALATAPVILLQLAVLTPIALFLLDVLTSGGVSVVRVLTQPLRNPIVIASAAGIAIAALGIELPAPVLQPFESVGAAAIPIVLLTLGMALSTARPLANGSDRRSVALAVGLKLLAMPMCAWLIGRFLFGLEGHDLFVAVALAALPTANNVFNYALRYNVAVDLARDTLLITTVLSIPVLVSVAALLAP